MSIKTSTITIGIPISIYKEGTPTSCLWEKITTNKHRDVQEIKEEIVYRSIRVDEEMANYIRYRAEDEKISIVKLTAGLLLLK